jgi:kynurenine 3-monooxygenase
MAMGRLVVVGGGLTGSLLAVHLARRGHEVDVFERRGEARDARPWQGERRPAVNLTLCERGLKALADVGLRETVQGLCAPARGRKIHALDGSVQYQPYGNHGEAIYSISRAELNQTLADFARREPRVRFHFDQKFVGMDLERTIARFEHTQTGTLSEVHADRIFGADGAHSGVRYQMQKTEHFNYSQQYWAFGGYVSLGVPPRSKDQPALDGEALHIWPRGNRMLIGFPNRDGSAVLSLLLPFRGEESYESLSTEAAVLDFFRSYFPDAVDSIPELGKQFFSKPANSLITVRCDPWSHRDNVLLIGDAAHAILPSYGQGANSGFEDCSTLEHSMREHGDDWRAVFQAFEQARRPSMDVMADLCVEHFSELCDLIADPKFLKQREVERNLGDLYPDLYRPLYSMVSFDCVPYVEAFAIEQAQRAIIDRIIAMNGVSGRLDTPEIRQLLEQSTQGKALAARAASRSGS